MEIIKIIGIGFVTALIALLLKPSKPELSVAVTVTGTIIILCEILTELKEIFGIMQSVSELTGTDGTLIKTVLKMIGIGYLTEFSASTLTDFGANSVADKVVLAGKITIVALSVPIIKSLLSILGTFLSLI